MKMSPVLSLSAMLAQCDQQLQAIDLEILRLENIIGDFQGLMQQSTARSQTRWQTISLGETTWEAFH